MIVKSFLFKSILNQFFNEDDIIKVAISDVGVLLQMISLCGKLI